MDTFMSVTLVGTRIVLSVHVVFKAWPIHMYGGKDFVQALLRRSIYALPGRINLEQ